jgi:hypothetical protein
VEYLFRQLLLETAVGTAAGTASLVVVENSAAASLDFANYPQAGRVDSCFDPCSIQLFLFFDFSTFFQARIDRGQWLGASGSRLHKQEPEIKERIKVNLKNKNK